MRHYCHGNLKQKPKTVENFFLQVINLLPSFLIKFNKHVILSLVSVFVFRCPPMHSGPQHLHSPPPISPNGAPPSFVSCSTLTVDCSCGYCIALYGCITSYGTTGTDQAVSMAAMESWLPHNYRCTSKRWGFLSPEIICFL